MGADLFQELKEIADTQARFASVADHIEQAKISCHQFVFKYPLKDAGQAKTFSKVMQIKAQEAHRFVPVIMDCQALEKKNLGFSRQIIIQNGPLVQEHVLLDQETDSVIFVEEFVVLPDGKTVPGSFAAINRITQEEGRFFFYGIYLYDEEPTQATIETRDAMFQATYDNMIRFLETEDVDFVYSSLKEF